MTRALQDLAFSEYLFSDENYPSKQRDFVSCPILVKYPIVISLSPLKTRIGVFAQGQILCTLYIPEWFTAWSLWCPPPLAPILDDRKLISIAFLAISDQYATFFFLHKMAAASTFWMTKNHFRSPFQINTQLFFSSQNGLQRPVWMTENHFRSHFSPFQINTQLFFLHKMAASGHFGWPKITFDHISHHFRSIRNFFFTKWLATAILDDRKSLSIAFLAISDQYAAFFSSQNGCQWPFWMTENHFWSHFSPFQINTQLLFSQNGCQRSFWMTENHFRSHFSPFQINMQLFFLHKMAAGGHFGWPKIAFDHISRHFRSICSFDFFWFFFTENHFWIHFSPFQINTQFFFSKWPPTAILEVRFGPFWMTENHFRSHFSPFQINTQLFVLLFFFKMAASGHFGSPICAKNNRVLPLCVINGYAKYEVDRWICDTVRDATSFLRILYKMAARGHFVFPIDDKNHRVLVIWDLNGYGEYEVNRCIFDKVMACTSVGVRRRRRQRRNQKHNITEIFKFRG